jgi:hypothetical protein
LRRWHWCALGALLLAGCQRKLPDDVPSVNSVGLVPAAPKALGARAANLEPPAVPEPVTPMPSSGPDEPDELAPGLPTVDAGVPL